MKLISKIVIASIVLLLGIILFVIIGVKTGYLKGCPYEPSLTINGIQIDDCILRCDYKDRFYEYGYNLTISTIKDRNKRLLLKGKIHCGENKFTFSDIEFNDFLMNKDKLRKEIRIDLKQK